MQIPDFSLPILSIRQPWAWLIVNCHKPVENRGWPTRVRGPILIHAGKQWDKDFDYEWGEDLIQSQIPIASKMELGGIVGMASISDCVSQMDSPWFFGLYGFILKGAHPLPFYPLKGQLGFFRHDPNV